MDDILAFTGHRPDKLGGYSDTAFAALVGFAEDFLKTDRPAIAISGLALGWDQAVAQAATNLQIPWIAAIPFVGQEGRWPDASKARYAWLVERATWIHVVSGGGYHPAKLHERNEWMVDNGHRLAALWNGSDGGTFSCVRYAHRRKVPVTQLWDDWQVWPF